MSKIAKPVIRFLTSPACGLCKPGLFLMQRIREQRDADFDLHVINIRERKYSDKYGGFCEVLPVLMYEDQILAQTKFVEEEIRQIIEQIVRTKKQAGS
jgi:CRISPR/Cas system CMR-associated protein Cmr5 small subunit